MPKPYKNEKKKDYISRCIKVLVDEGKEQKQAIAICFSMWDQHNLNENIITTIDTFLQSPQNFFIDVREFINVIGRVKFRQFSNSEDMLKFAKIYYNDFFKTFGRSTSETSWNYFSDRLTEYWLTNIYGK